MSLVEAAPLKPNDVVPFVYGSIAFSLGKTEDGTTHRWTIYVRGVNGKDLSSIISKVTFKLHPTCTSPLVECVQHPFETTQPGWGEFPATIDITFKDEKQSTVSLTHHLRLHHIGGTAQGNKPVVHEAYDEAIFTNPSPEFNLRLQQLQNALIPHHPHSVYWKTFSDETDLETIHKAHAFVKSQLEIALKEFAEIDSEVKNHLASSSPEAKKSPEAHVPPAVPEPDTKRVRLDAAS
jgi:hypothetical protein